MDISVEELSPVEKELTLSAGSEDLKPKIDAAYKKYKKQINMPGFRPGKVPVSIIKKRFGDTIVQEEINDYIQEVFEKEIIPKHEPIGEPQVVSMDYEDGELEAVFKIGTKPEFELKELSDIEVDKMVHDVTDEETEEEIERILKNASDWEEVEESITSEHRVTVDAKAVDEDRNPIEDDVEEDQVLDLEEEQNKLFLDALEGKSTGDVVTVTLGEDDDDQEEDEASDEQDQQTFELTVKKIEKIHKQELTEEFVKEETNGEVENEDEFKSNLKSRIQQYYDQSSDQLLQQEIIDKMVDAHDFDIPESVVDKVIKSYMEQRKERSGGEFPEDFDRQAFREQNEEQALRDGKWQFINQKLQEKFDDIEITPEDIDAHLAKQGAQYGISVDQMKQIYAQNANQLEQLRNTIRSEKVFKKLEEAIKINEISKEEYQNKQEENEANSQT